jgi:hypothetical protein
MRIFKSAITFNMRKLRTHRGLSRFSILMAMCSACMVASSLAQPADAPSATSAGMVKRVTGTASLLRAGTRTPVVAGAPVQVGDTLSTGADGAVGITLSDDTLLTVGANSELVLSTYNFDSTTQDGSLLVSLWRGTAAFVTGLIGKKAPEKVQVQTRTVVLGVRGTEFIVDAQQGKP